MKKHLIVAVAVFLVIFMTALTMTACDPFESTDGAETTAFMGDQIFTDVCCARFSGATAYLVPPILDKTDAGTRFKRRLEKGILRRFYKKHQGEPDIREGSPLTNEFLQELERQQL